MTTEAMTEAETNEAMREMFDAAEKAERARDDEAKEVFDHAEEIEHKAIRLLALDEAAAVVAHERREIYEMSDHAKFDRDDVVSILDGLIESIRGIDPPAMRSPDLLKMFDDMVTAIKEGIGPR